MSLMHAPSTSVPPEMPSANEAFRRGYAAASDGMPESLNPYRFTTICADWVRGYNAFKDTLIR